MSLGIVREHAERLFACSSYAHILSVYRKQP